MVVRRRQWVCGVFLFCAVTVTASLAQITTLVNFSGTNGYYPSMVLTQGADGNFYGTTQWGGVNNGCEFGCGTVFRMTPSGTLTTLYNFCTPQYNCADGSIPMGSLVQARSGDFYGTTSEGGTYGGGTVFKITARGTLTTLYSFCTLAGCVDGSYPSGKLILAANGDFYGTTKYGGTYHPDCNVVAVTCGTVFKITPSGTLTTLYSFCAVAGCVDGYYPSGGLVQAANGNFYGVTAFGGSNNNYLCGSSCGTVFELTSAGELTTLHSFDLSDGNSPTTGLVQGPNGDFYGGTFQGGTGDCGLGGFSAGCGTIFKITRTGLLTTLYDFCGCADGAYPNGLVQGTDGNFYGTTQSRGSRDAGTIFEINPEGTLSTLYAFCGGICGYSPVGGLAQGTDGNFYGTTSGGGSGTQGGGTIFSLSTGLGPFVNLPSRFGKVGQTGGILGQGFTGTSGVFLNGDPASFTVVSDTYIKATVPVGATTGFVTVQTPSGTLTSNVPFGVLQ
jgi:uncharacterized repeat protein (TIGR03803 family)